MENKNFEPEKSNTQNLKENDVKMEDEEKEKIFEEEKKVGAFQAVSKGRKLGISPEKLNQFVQKVIEEKTKEQDYGFVFRFQKGLGIGNEEETKRFGELAYQKAFEMGNYDYAADVAKELKGEESLEYKRAVEEGEKKALELKDKGEKDLGIKLSRDATFSDLFNVLAVIKLNEKDVEIFFDGGIWDYLNNEDFEQAMFFLKGEEGKNIKIVDFFDKIDRALPLQGEEIILPVKLRRKN